MKSNFDGFGLLGSFRCPYVVAVVVAPGVFSLDRDGGGAWRLQFEPC